LSDIALMSFNSADDFVALVRAGGACHGFQCRVSKEFVEWLCVP
jgi:hypothetical protein